MAVLVEAISVIVRRDAIERRYRGGWREFVSSIPNNTFCMDDTLTRVGFMVPPDVEAFVKHLEKNGLTFITNGQAIDIAVVDQMRGPTVPAEWLEFSHLSFGQEGGKVAACWLFEGPRHGHGVHVPAGNIQLATPNGWVYEKSLSANFKFVTSEQLDEKLKFLRRDKGTDIYLDLTTGKEVYIARPKV